MSNRLPLVQSKWKCSRIFTNCSLKIGFFTNMSHPASEAKLLSLKESFAELIITICSGFISLIYWQASAPLIMGLHLKQRKK